MTRKFLSAAVCLSVVASPTAALACDLDGLPGFHRFNPFAKIPGFQGLAPPSGPRQQETAPQRATPKKAEKRGSEKPKTSKSQARAAKAATPLDRLAGEQDWTTGPISTEEEITEV